ncbi:MAG: hypothetical protein KF892_03780 [Rhizobacter sp.]|nr:hypothetical protein [Rhizobacter sp.]
MTYDEIAKSTERLGYRDKLRLAQLLIQVARKEEEEQRPDKRDPKAAGPTDPELLQYVADRLKKLKAGKKESVLNSIGAMFQFQGGISDKDREKMFAELVKARHITLDGNRVQYAD